MKVRVAMSRLPPAGNYAVWRLAAFAGPLLFAQAVHAQEYQLRGAVNEQEVSSSLLAGGTEGIPAPAYEPASQGAVPDEEMDTLFPSGEGVGTTISQEPFPPLNPPDRPASRPSSRTNEAEDPSSSTAADANPPDAGIDDLSTGGMRPAGPVESEYLEEPRRLNQPVVPVEGQARDEPQDPYAPLGLRIGTFNVVPQLEQGLTWTSNANNSPDGGEAVLSQTTLRLRAVSDWSRHGATVNAFGTYRKSISGEEVSELEGGADAALRLDFADDLTGTASLGYRAARESASSPVVIASVDRQPLRHTIDGTLGIEKSLGRLRLGLAGDVTRIQYGEAELSDGTRLSQDDRNSTLALMRLRAGYEISPSLAPFVEVEGGRRFYDEENDSAGYARSATRLGARAGLTVNMSEKLSGEISAGWISEDFEDSRLETISGLALAAAMEWSPVRETTVRLDGSTIVEGTTDAGRSGSLLYSGTLRATRSLRANLTGEAAFGAAYRDYVSGGHDLILSGEASLTWWLNRYAGLVGRARHERQTSSLPDRDYDTTSVFMGVTLRR